MLVLFGSLCFILVNEQFTEEQMEKYQLKGNSVWPASRVMEHLRISKSHLFNLQKSLGFKKYRFPALDAKSTGFGRVYFNIDEVVSALEITKEL